jgi:hypothetical protein
MSDSIGNRSLLDFFKTFWPGVLGWGCIVAGLVVFEYLPVESPEDLRPLLIGLLLATVGSILESDPREFQPVDRLHLALLEHLLLGAFAQGPPPPPAHAPARHPCGWSAGRRSLSTRTLRGCGGHADRRFDARPECDLVLWRVRDLARTLSDDGVLNPRTGGVWSPSTVAKILRRIDAEQ